MQCSEFEICLCDYLDERLEAAARIELEQHAAHCQFCTALLADSKALAGFWGQVEQVEEPRELITDILFRTRQARAGWAAGASGWRAWFQPLLQPRFVMGMAMTILSVSMFYRVAGGPVRQLQAADLNPSKIWRGVESHAIQLWGRGQRLYQNLRFLYEIAGQLRAAEQEVEAEREPGQTVDAPASISSPRSPPQRLEPLKEQGVGR